MLLVKCDEISHDFSTGSPPPSLPPKGEMCTLRMDKLCYNAININYVLVLVYVQHCRIAQSLVCHGPS